MKRTALFCAVAGCVFLADLLSQPGLTEGRWAHPPRASSTPAETTPAGATLRTRATAQTPPLLARSSAAPRRDSTALRIDAGDVLITTLPGRVAGRPVARYEMLRAPTMSDLAGRSFFWRTRARDAGRHRLLFRARHDTTPPVTATPDTLVLFVTVTD